MMKKIASFTINHDTLEKGMYISRIDGDVVTYDIRMKKPNGGDYFQMAAAHTLEHLFATYARNSKQGDKIVYVGPMGCRTGFYLLTFGKLTPEEIFPIIIETCDFIINFNGEIFGATPIECGNYSDQNLPLAKEYAKEYKERLIKYKNFIYPSK